MRGRPPHESNVIELQGRRAPRRKSLSLKPLGKPPRDMPADHRRAWAMFCEELPWLAESDRATLEVACALRAEFMSNGRQLSNAKLGMYRQLLAQLGGTPRDRNGVRKLPEGEAANKPGYFDK